MKLEYREDRKRVEFDQEINPFGNAPAVEQLLNIPYISISDDSGEEVVIPKWKIRNLIMALELITGDDNERS